MLAGRLTVFFGFPTQILLIEYHTAVVWCIKSPSQDRARQIREVGGRRACQILGAGLRGRASSWPSSGCINAATTIGILPTRTTLLSNPDHLHSTCAPGYDGHCNVGGTSKQLISLRPRSFKRFTVEEKLVRHLKRGRGCKRLLVPGFVVKSDVVGTLSTGKSRWSFTSPNMINVTTPFWAAKKRRPHCRS